MHVLRVCHAGRDPGHRARERALLAAGVQVTLVVPRTWPEGGSQARLTEEPFEIIEVDVRRPGDVNRHALADPTVVRGILARHRPDLLDLHEEPVSLVARQWLRQAGQLPVVMYTGQNVDKRFPPPFAQYETMAYRRIDGMYPCTRQAAAVARGKGFTGAIEVLPLGVDERYVPGDQQPGAAPVRLGLVGRLVPEKGVRDAVRVLAALRRTRATHLWIVGEGPERTPAEALARDLGVEQDVTFLPWQPLAELAVLYRDLHVLLVPSRTTATWVEQFGRIILEAQACGAVVAGYSSGAIPEVGRDACVLVPEGATDALSAEVARLLDCPERYGALRSRGLQQAAEATWPAVAERQRALYERVLAGRAPRATYVPGSTRRRLLARTEFGDSAELVGGLRPFALPVLREPNRLSRATARALDNAEHLLGR